MEMDQPAGENVEPKPVAASTPAAQPTQETQPAPATKPKRKVTPKIKVFAKEGTWDKGIDYYEAFTFFLNEYTRIEKMPKKLWTLFALIQLRNGCRAGEGIRAVLKWVETGERKQIVPVEKRRNATREIVIPKFVDEKMREKAAEYFKERGITLNDPQKLEKFIINYRTCLFEIYGINTHALRYAFVTYLLEKKVETGIIAKIIGHAGLQHLTRYVQEKKANDILENLD